MGLDLSARGQFGIVLMILGAIAFFPALAPTAGSAVAFLPAVAAIALTVGTWLVGTDTAGRVV